MKKLFVSLAVCLGIMVSTTPKSEAVVGAIVSAPAVMTVGGVVALAGGIGFTIAGARAEGNGFGGIIEYMIYGGIGLVTAGIGLVVLEGTGTHEIRFNQVDGSLGGGFSASEIETYNHELTRLNAIQQTISAEVAAAPRMDVRSRWQRLGSRLSPATLEIAAFNGSAFLQRLHVRH